MSTGVSRYQQVDRHAFLSTGTSRQECRDRNAFLPTSDAQAARLSPRKGPRQRRACAGARAFADTRRTHLRQFALTHELAAPELCRKLARAIGHALWRVWTRSAALQRRRHREDAAPRHAAAQPHAAAAMSPWRASRRGPRGCAVPQPRRRVRTRGLSGRGPRGCAVPQPQGKRTGMAASPPCARARAGRVVCARWQRHVRQALSSHPPCLCRTRSRAHSPPRCRCPPARPVHPRPCAAPPPRTRRHVRPCLPPALARRVPEIIRVAGTDPAVTVPGRGFGPCPGPPAVLLYISCVYTGGDP